MGEETAQLLVRQGLVRELADLFDLDPEALLKLPGFAAKKRDNLVAGIRQRREPELERFLFALGIPEVGVTVARDLARHFRGLEAIRLATEEELAAVPGVGPVMSETIHGFFENDQNRLAIDRILGHGVAPIVPKSIVGTSAPLAGRKFVFTGGLAALSRARAKELVEKAGALVTGTVSRETDYVVVGDDPGSKHEKAEKLGVTTLNEGEFVALLKDAGLEAV